MRVLLKSNFSARSCRAVILRKVSDWLALINDIFKMSDLAATTSHDNTASVGITFVDKLHNLSLEKCGKSSRRHRAVRSRRIRGKSMRIVRNLSRKKVVKL